MVEENISQKFRFKNIDKKRSYFLEVGLKLCAITAGIKNYKSIIKKEKKKLDKTVLLAQSKLNNIEVLISKALIDSVISHDEFVLIYNVQKENDEMKQEITKSNNK